MSRKVIIADYLLDTYGRKEYISRKIEVLSIFEIEIFSLKQIAEIVLRFPYKNPIFVFKEQNILIYLENRYVSLWLILEDLWGEKSLLKNLFHQGGNASIEIDIVEFKIFYRDVLSKRNGIDKKTKIALTDEGIVIKNIVSYLIKGKEISFPPILPFSYDLNEIKYIDKELHDRRKVIDRYTPELLDILLYFPLRYNEHGYSYITDRLTILCKKNT